MDAPTTAMLAVEELNAAWQQSLEQLLRISPGRLQLLQPPPPAPVDSAGLWKELDTLPTADAVSAAPAAGPSFAQTYGAVILNLLPPRPTALVKALGDYYTPWTSYLNTNPTLPPGGVTVLFREWAADNVPDPSIAQAGFSALVGLEHAPVPLATKMYQAAQAAGQGFAYNATSDDLANALSCAPNLTISFQLPPIDPGCESSESTDTGGPPDPGASTARPDPAVHPAAEGESPVTGGASAGRGPGQAGGGAPDPPGGGNSTGDGGSLDDGGTEGGTDPVGSTLFAAEAGPAADALGLKLLSGGLSVKASFASLLQFSAGPLSQSAGTPPLSQYMPWYYSPALTMAYQTSDNTLWRRQPPTWSQTFGPGGSLPRVCTALAVVDGISLTLTSPIPLTRAEQQTLRTAVAYGTWPFFVTPQSPWSVTVTFAGSRPTITVACPAGNPQLLGRTVTPIQAALGLSS